MADNKPRLSELLSRPTSGYTQTTFQNNSTTSLASTLTISSVNSATSVPKWHINTPQYDADGQKLDAMSRKYPAPSPGSEMSLEEMLALPPLPRSLHHELQKKETEKKEIVNSKEEREEELEAAKKRWRAWAVGGK